MTTNTPPETTAAELLDRAKSLCTEVMKRGKFAPHNAEVLWSAIDVYQQNTRLDELAALKAQQPTTFSSKDCPNCGGLAPSYYHCDECGWDYVSTHQCRRKDGTQQPSGAQAGLVGRMAEALLEARGELRACQCVISLRGGFDPAYVDGARKSIDKIDLLLAEYDASPLPDEPKNEGWPTGRAESELRRITTPSPLPASEPPPQQPVAARVTETLQRALEWVNVPMQASDAAGLRREIEDALEAIAPMLGQGKEIDASIPEQTDEARDKARDAMRYRWLRDEAYEAVIPHGNTLAGKRTAWITKLHAGESFDAAIDAAMSAEGKG